ncbi:MAG: L,D-transpeptidase family protein [Desulfuromonadales bacterium]
MHRLLFITVVVFFLSGGSPSAGQVSGVVALLNQETSQQIERLLSSRESGPSPIIGVARLLAHDQIFNLYNKRGFTPLWLDGWQLKPGAFTLLENLRNAGAHGLCGDDYLLVQLEGLIGLHKDFARKNLPLAPQNRAVLDLFLSQAFLTFASHMVEGQVDPRLAHVDWRARQRKVHLLKLLEYALDNDRMPQVLEGLYPPHEEYRNLVAALALYQKLSALGGWPVIPSGPAIRPGDRNHRVRLLKELLQTTGDLTQVTEAGPLYDEETVAAMMKFQARHGLVDDGVIGSKTLVALNVPVEERIRQIELNLERWRWMPKSFGKQHLRVNVADFSLVVVEDGETVLQMPVIVGTQYRKTPVFSAQMSYLEFAPYWTVPPTILREDKLPIIKQNWRYLEEKHFRIVSRSDAETFIDPEDVDWQNTDVENFPGLLRMEPGPWNPLGRVKFMFPNRFNVYLHDTNESYLFDNNVRSFSSGCIRVKRPDELAYYLLQEELGAARLEELLAASEPEQVPIKPVPVHIQYWTAWVDQEGLVNFRPDVYFRDLDLEVVLKNPAYRVMEQLQASSG